VIFWPRYVGSWRAKTAALSPLEKGIYGELLDYQYSTEGPLPPTFEENCRIAGARTPIECRAVERVLVTMFKKNGVGYTNERVEEEIEHFKKISAVKTKAAETRWKREREKKEHNE